MSWSRVLIMESRTEFLLSQNLESVSRVMYPLSSGSQRANTWGGKEGEGGRERERGRGRGRGGWRGEMQQGEDERSGRGVWVAREIGREGEREWGRGTEEE